MRLSRATSVVDFTTAPRGTAPIPVLSKPGSFRVRQMVQPSTSVQAVRVQNGCRNQREVRTIKKE